jgi:transcription initiation factor TFIIIB Brf1 subunit/transcription initiation factor TFIIB
MIDVEDEFVCESCGSVTAKEVIESHEMKPQAIDYTKHSLGSYLGPLEYGYEEKFSKGFSHSSSTFRYLKTVSDYSYREDGSAYSCAKMIERICEKLLIPKGVIGQAINIAKSMLEMKGDRSRFTIAAISSFSIITACKMYGITSVGVREAIEAHRSLEYRVKISTIIQMSIDSPIRLRARRAEEYLNRIITHLSSNESFKKSLNERGLNESIYSYRLLEIAKKILQFIDETMRGGHSPSALAATSVYAAEILLARAEFRKKRLTQRELAKCANVAEYTVREQYVEIFRPHMEEIFKVIEGVSPLQRRSMQTYQKHLQNLRLS